MNRLKSLGLPKMLWVICLLGVFIMLNSVDALVINAFNNSLSAENLSFSGSIARYLAIPSSGIGAITSGSFNLTYSPNIAGLSAWWKFDETSGDAIDSSFNGHTLKNFAPTYVNGKFNNALYSTSSAFAQTMNTSGSADFAFDKNNFTIAFWYNNSVLTTNNYPIQVDYKNAAGWGYVSAAAGAKTLCFANNGGCVLTTPVLVENTWNRIVVVREGIGANQLKLYVNKINTQNATFNVNISLSNVPLNMSGSGMFDEFKIYNRYALNTTFINSDYNTNTAPAQATNVSILIGTTVGDSIIADSNSSNITTTIKVDGLASYINNYLSTCSYVSGYCNVLFNFTSQYPTTIGYSNIEVSDSGFIENNIYFTNSTFVNNRETFNLNISYYPSSYPAVSAIFYYNNTAYTTTYVDYGDDRVFSSSIIVPYSSSQKNYTFYWSLLMNNGTSTEYYNSSKNNQTVNAIILDNCAAYHNVIFNVTNFDELNLSAMIGTVDYVLNITNGNYQAGLVNGTTTGIAAAVCSDVNLSTINYSYSLALRYYKSDNTYLPKTYNIDNFATTSLPINIQLYYLNKTSGTEFTINYVDFYYVTHPNAILQIQKQYISQNGYKVVEAPKILDSGLAQGAFDTSNIKYKVIVVEEGSIIDIFENVMPICQNYVLGTCTLNLRGKKTTSSTSTGDDFTYTLSNSGNVLTVTYVIPSGIPKIVIFSAAQSSAFLTNITTCDYNYLAAGGTFTCAYNGTVGDSRIDVHLNVDNSTNLYGHYIVSEDLSSFFLLNNYFIASIILITLALIFIGSGMMIVVSAVIGIFYLGMVFLIRGVNFTTALSSFAWLVIAAVIIIFKISQKEDRS